MEPRAKNLIINNITLLKSFVEKFSTYQVVKIDLMRIVYFISQFRDYERIKVVIKLIENIDFLDSKRITYLLKKAYDKISDNLIEKPLISSLGSIQDSSAVVCYHLLKQLFDDEKTTLNLTSDVNSIGANIEADTPTSIIFFDDNITSGTQLAGFFEELILGKNNAEQVKTPLTAKQYELIKKIPIRICYAIQLAEESNKVIDEIRKKYELDLEMHSGKADFNNYLDYQSDTMDSENEAKFSRDFIREISEPLFEDKNWDNETIYNRLLGYGNLGKLTVFYYNVPKSLIPVFWKYGNYNGKPWIPLFPETQQIKILQKNKIEYEYYQAEAIEGWISAVPQNRKPDIVFGVRTAEGIASEITLEIPSIDEITDSFRKYLYPDILSYSPNQATQTDAGNIKSILTNIYPTSVLNNDDYNSYKNAVDNYNQELSSFYDQLRQFIYQQASNTNVVFEIANKGNIAVTNCIVKLLYNSGQLLLDDFDNLPVPTFDKDKPIVTDFDSSDSRARISFSKQMFESISILRGSKREPIDKETDYEYKLFSDSRIGHNDRDTKNVEITRMNLACSQFIISYEINFDEEAETITGNITINFRETKEISESLKKELFKSIEKIK